MVENRLMRPALRSRDSESPAARNFPYGYVWVVCMRLFWDPTETVIGGRSGLLRGPGRPPRPLRRPRGWSGATVSIQMGSGSAEDRGLRSVTCMGESSLEY